MPALDFDFRIAVRLNQEAVHVDSGNTKEITTVAAGVWSGSFGHGRVIVRLHFFTFWPPDLIDPALLSNSWLTEEDFMCGL
jgi:hypothetical protein